MHSSIRRKNPARHPSAHGVLLLLALIAALPTVSAQNVILTPEQDPLLVSAQRKLTPPPPLSRPPAGPETPYQLGGFVLHPRVSYKHMRADGLPIHGQSQRGESEISSFSPGLTLDMGDFWSLDYSPSWVRYSNDALTDSVEHSARLNGSLTAQDWAMNFSQSYDKSNQTLIETAQQTDRKSWATVLGATYRHSPKLQLQFSGAMNERQTSLAPNLRTWSAESMVNYLVSDQVSLNLRPRYTYTEVAAAPDYEGESFLVQMSWRPAEKIALNLGGGVQSTRSKSSLGVDQSNPLLDLSLSYQPFATTGLSAAYERSSSASYFRSQTTDNRSFRLGVNQRLLGRLYLSASYARQETDYVALTSTVAAPREDRIDLLSLRLSTRFFQRLSTSLVFQKSKNRSNLATFDFTSSQFGVELGYRY